jgi:hypothetical protein
MPSSYFRLFLGFLLFNYHSFSQQPIDTSETMLIGGIRQYIRTKGQDNSKPVLLFLHGGPEYFNEVSAPKKDMFLFRDVGHGLPETHPDWFQEMIIDKILPQTFNSSQGF